MFGERPGKQSAYYFVIDFPLYSFSNTTHLDEGRTSKRYCISHVSRSVTPTSNLSLLLLRDKCTIQRGSNGKSLGFSCKWRIFCCSLSKLECTSYKVREIESILALHKFRQLLERVRGYSQHPLGRSGITQFRAGLKPPDQDHYLLNRLWICPFAYTIGE